MNTKSVKTAVLRPVNFTKKHRVAVAVTLTALVAVKWQMNTARFTREFLEEHGLYETYLAWFDEDEL